MAGRRAFSAVVLLLSLLCAESWAQAWPSRPIRIVVPLAPGGSNDVVARLLASNLPSPLGQPVVTENKAGAGGNIGCEYVAKSAPDGYTLLLTPSPFVGNVFFFAKIPYDPVKDFEPISLVSSVPFVLTIRGGLPVRTTQEFIAYGRAHPGMTYASAGIGQFQHVTAELLKSMTGLDLVHVPYKGAGAFVPALLAGEVDFTIGAINSLLPHIRSGKLHALAVAGGARTALLPDVPTIAESAPLPDYDMTSWSGVLAPAGTPRPIINRLSAEINRILQNPAMASEKLSASGIEPRGTTPERFAEIIKSQLGIYARITKDAKIKPE